MPTGAAGGSTANEETQTASDDDVEEIQGRPRDGREHVYVWRQRGDHFIGHEELAETEEAARVERAAKHLVDEVKVSGPFCCSMLMRYVRGFDMCSSLQGIMKTAKYRKRCFDQIEGIVAENKALSAEVDRLRWEAGDKVAEMSAQGERLLDLTRVWPTSIGKGQVSRVLRAAVCSRVVSFVDLGIVPVDFEEEVARLRQEKEQLGQELAGALETGRRAGEELSNRNRELSGNNRATTFFIWLLHIPFLVLTSCLVCSAQGEYQEAFRRSGQGSGLLEDQLH